MEACKAKNHHLSVFSSHYKPSHINHLASSKYNPTKQFTPRSAFTSRLPTHSTPPTHLPRIPRQTLYVCPALRICPKSNNYFHLPCPAPPPRLSSSSCISQQRFLSNKCVHSVTASRAMHRVPAQHFTSTATACPPPSTCSVVPVSWCDLSPTATSPRFTAD